MFCCDSTVTKCGTQGLMLRMLLVSSRWRIHISSDKRTKELSKNPEVLTILTSHPGQVGSYLLLGFCSPCLLTPNLKHAMTCRLSLTEGLQGARSWAGSEQLACRACSCVNRPRMSCVFWDKAHCPQRREKALTFVRCGFPNCPHLYLH